MESHLLETAKNELLAKRANLYERIAKIQQNKTQAKGPLDANSTEQAVELQSHEVVDALDNLEKNELKQIEMALHLIANGTYGICIKCGEDVSPARLKARPYSTKCLACADQ